MAKIKEEIKETSSNEELENLLKTHKDSHFAYEEHSSKTISTGSLQLDSLVKVKSGSIVRLVGKGAELGKAQPLWANVLTPTGWKTIGSLKIGDDIINSDGGKSKVLKIFPQGIKKINKILFSDNTSAFCCDEHLWFTRTCYDRNDKKTGTVKNTLEIKQTLLSGPHHNHSIPYVKPITFSHQENLLIDSYVMGVLLGDGCFRHGKFRIGLSTSDKEILDAVNQKIPKQHPFVKNSKKCKYGYTVHSVEFANIFNKYNLLHKFSYEKHIPKEYLFASIEDRRKLLQGLMDTDGSPHTKNGSCCEYSTTSKQLCEDVEFLVRSLGGRASTKERYTFFTYKGEKKQGRLSYRIHISFADFCPFSLKRKALKYYNRKFKKEKFIINVVECDKKEECVCIKVSSKDNLYITDGFNLTHNTSECLVFAENYMKTMPKSKTIFIKAEGRLGEELQKRSGLKFVFSSEAWQEGTVFVLPCNVFEICAQILETLLKKMHENGEHLCIIIDSLDGLTLRADLAKDIWGEKENVKVAGVPLLTKLLFRRLSLPINYYGALLLITGQYSAEIKLDPYSPNVPRQVESSGGNAIAHQSDYVFSYMPRFFGDMILKDPDERYDITKNPILGVYATIEIKKSGTDVSGNKIKIPIKKGVIGCAIWKSKEVGDLLLSWDCVIREKPFFIFKPDILKEASEKGIQLPEKIKGINKYYAFLEENENVTEHFYQKFKQALTD